MLPPLPLGSKPPCSDLCVLRPLRGVISRCFAALLACGAIASGNVACGPGFFAQEQVRQPQRALAPVEELVATTPETTDVGQGCSPKGCLRGPLPIAATLASAPADAATT